MSSETTRVCLMAENEGNLGRAVDSLRSGFNITAVETVDFSQGHSGHRAKAVILDLGSGDVTELKKALKGFSDFGTKVRDTSTQVQLTGLVEPGKGFEWYQNQMSFNLASQHVRDETGLWMGRCRQVEEKIAVDAGQIVPGPALHPVGV